RWKGSAVAIFRTSRFNVSPCSERPYSGAGIQGSPVRSFIVCSSLASFNSDTAQRHLMHHTSTKCTERSGSLKGPFFTEMKEPFSQRLSLRARCEKSAVEG